MSASPDLAPEHVPTPTTITVIHEVKPPRIRFLSAAHERNNTRSSWGPNIHLKETTVIVVLGGQGEIMLSGVNHPAHAGQAFAVPRGVVAFHHTDFQAPEAWEPCWVCFDGEDANDVLQRIGFTVDRPVLNVGDTAPLKDIVTRMLVYSNRSYRDGMMLQGLMYTFLSTLMDSVTSVAQELEPKGNRYLDAAVNYIHAHLNEPLQVSDVADALYISRSYLCMVFQEHLKISPKIFIMKAKMFQAAEDLRHSETPIGQLAERYGYATPFAFSKAFRRIIGVGPREFRERLSAPDELIVERYPSPSARHSPAARS